VTNEIGRRSYINKLTGEELMLRDCVTAIENLGAHPKLTDAVAAVQMARTCLADWVDLQKANDRPGK